MLLRFRLPVFSPALSRWCVTSKFPLPELGVQERGFCPPEACPLPRSPAGCRASGRGDSSISTIWYRIDYWESHRVCGCHFEGCRLSGLMRCVGCCLSEALALVD
eukprot:sb/3477903/